MTRLHFPLALLLAAPLSGAAQTPTAPPPTLAVLDLADGGSIGPDRQDLANLGIGLAVMLTTEMMRNPRVQMVERDQIKQLVEEMKLQLGGLVDPATAAKVGKLLGARYMLFGAYTDVYSRLRIDVRVVEVETGRLLRGQEVTDKREELFESVGRLAGALFKGLDLAPPAASPAQVPVPARAALLLSRGIGFEDRGDKEKAKQMYRAALEVHPQFEDAQKRLKRLESGS